MRTLFPTLAVALVSVAAISLPVAATARDHDDRNERRSDDRRERREDRRDWREDRHNAWRHHNHRYYRDERIVRETVVIRQPPRVVYRQPVYEAPVYRERSGVVVQIGLPPIIFPFHH